MALKEDPSLIPALHTFQEELDLFDLLYDPLPFLVHGQLLALSLKLVRATAQKETEIEVRVAVFDDRAKD